MIWFTRRKRLACEREKREEILKDGGKTATNDNQVSPMTKHPRSRIQPVTYDAAGGRWVCSLGDVL